MECSEAVRLAAWNAAIAAGDSVRGTTWPNPSVGCAIVAPDGRIVGVGATQPPGGTGEHAEVMALRQAGELARGATAFVTLEPCNHTGRTGPCSHALYDAGIAAVHYATLDPNPTASGGADFLRQHGIPATHEPREVSALEPWLHGVRHRRPFVTVKMAHTLDGFSAAQDGSSQWITGEQARAHAHEIRASRDAIIVGTGTVLADNPRLTARRLDGSLYPHQPQPVIIGSRPIPAKLHLGQGGELRYSSISEALSDLFARGYRDILVEGGPGLVGAFVSAGLADAIHSYINPSLLGAGLNPARLVLDEPTSMKDIRRFHIHQLRQLGNDIFIESRLS